MDFAEVKQKLEAAEVVLVGQPTAVFAEFHTPHGELRVVLTDRLRRKCRKGRVWKSPAMLSALKNAAYGYDLNAPRSRGGADGIFLVDRDFRPVNSMVKKLFDQFIDKPDPLVPVLADVLRWPKESWIPVRLVSHHMRLLGIISALHGITQLTLIDYDDAKDS